MIAIFIVVAITFLNKLIVQGLSIHEVDLEHTKISSKYKQILFNLDEVEEWLRVHVF